MEIDRGPHWPLPALPYFTYEPFGNASKEFRLVSIVPDRSGGQIHVSIRNYRLSDDEIPRYRCLSYTWGNPDDTYEIALNGCFFKVRRNLYDFLEKCTQVLPDEHLWIDALCIDQNTMFEKGVQVSQMGSIYSKASGVLLWLGNDPALISLARYIGLESDDYRQDEEQELVASYGAFCRHIYWTRTWITQELLVARSIHVMTSSYGFDWRNFGRVVKLGSQSTLTATYEMYKETTKHQNTSPNGQEGGNVLGSYDFWQILKWRGHTDCTFTNDRIFALLALVQGGYNLRVSYQEKPVDLFWRAGEHFRAWSSIDNMERLRTALKLSRRDIIENLKGQNEESRYIRLRIPVLNAYFPSRLPWKKNQQSCGHCGQHLPDLSIHEIVLCSTPDSSVVIPGQEYVHVVVKEKPKVKPKPWDPVEYRILPTSRAADYYECEGWITLNCQPDKPKRLKSIAALRKKLKRADLQPMREHWDVEVQGSYVLHCLELAEGMRMAEDRD